MRSICPDYENKLDAGMTKNQPRGYLQVLKNRTAAKKVLTFLVPAERKKELQTTLAPYTVKSTGIGIHVCTWEDLAELLTKSFAESELIREFSGDIQRRCKVQSPLTLDNLKSASDVLAGWLHQRELLKAIREKLQAEPIFKGLTVTLEAKPEWDEEHCYMGMTISASHWVFWIGFWNLLQRKDPNYTPLLGHVYESKEARKLFPKFWSSLKQLRAANVVAPLVHGHGWPIPVPFSIMQSETVREQAENVVAYIVPVLDGDATVNRKKQLGDL